MSEKCGSRWTCCSLSAWTQMPSWCCNVKNAVKCPISTFGASKCFCFCQSFFHSRTETRRTHGHTQIHTHTHRLTQFSIMLLDMSWMRLSRCLANSSSGQCRSLMKVWRASSFQKRSSDVPEPLLPSTPNTQTRTGQGSKVTLLDRESKGGKEGGGGVLLWQVQRRVLLLLFT